MMCGDYILFLFIIIFHLRLSFANRRTQLFYSDIIIINIRVSRIPDIPIDLSDRSNIARVLLVIGIILVVLFIGISLVLGSYINENTDPRADLDTQANTLTFEVGEPITLDASSSTVETGNDLRYEFDTTGDGKYDTESEESRIEKTYDSTQNLEISVRVTDIQTNNTDTASMNIRVVEQSGISNINIWSEDRTITTQIVAETNLKSIDASLDGGTNTELNISDFRRSIDGGNVVYENITVADSSGDTTFVIQSATNDFDADIIDNFPLSDTTTIEPMNASMSAGSVINPSTINVTITKAVDIDVDTLDKNSFSVVPSQVESVVAEKTSADVIEAQLNLAYDTDSSNITVYAEASNIKLVNSTSNAQFERRQITISSQSLDSIAPRLIQTSAINEDTIELTFREDGSGLDKQALQQSNISINDAGVSASIINSSIDNGETTPATVRISIDGEPEQNASEIYIETVSDLAGNSATDVKSTIPIDDSVSPTVETINVNNRSLLLEIRDEGSGINMEDLDASDFELSNGQLRNAIDTQTLEKRDGRTVRAQVTLQLAEDIAIDDDILIIQGVTDEKGNEIDDVIAVSGIDTREPQVDDIELIDQQTIELRMVDNGSGINFNTLSSDSFSIDERTVNAVDVTQENESEAEIMISVTDPIEENDIVSLNVEEPILDNNDNVLREGFLLEVGGTSEPQVTIVKNDPFRGQIIESIITSNTELTNFTVTMGDETFTYDDYIESKPNTGSQFSNRFRINQVGEYTVTVTNITTKGTAEIENTSQTFTLEATRPIQGDSESIFDFDATGLTESYTIADNSIRSSLLGNYIVTMNNTNINTYYADNKSKLWSQEITTPSNIDPYLSGDTIAIQSDDGVRTYDIKTGELKNVQTFDEANAAKIDRFGNLYFNTDDKQAISYNISSGDINYEIDGHSEQPVDITETSILSANGTKMFVYNRDSGSLIAQSNFGSEITRFEANADWVSIIRDNKLHIHDRQSLDTITTRQENVTEMISGQDHLYIHTDNGQLKSINADDLGSVEWQFNIDYTVDQMLYTNGELHTRSNNTLYTYNIDDGTQINTRTFNQSTVRNMKVFTDGILVEHSGGVSKYMAS